MSRNRWSASDSADLTATLVVVDGNNVNGSRLTIAELRAIVLMAHRMKIRRSVIARRLGWSPNRLWKWAHDHNCALPEDGFPDAPLGWLTRSVARGLTAGGRDGGFNVTPKNAMPVKPWLGDRGKRK